jgi:hypothetical protein
MFEALPRELRDLVYDNILVDACVADERNDTSDEDTLNVDERKVLPEARSTTPLDKRFSFLKRHYFQASYMGTEFVKELINTYFRKAPFKVRAEELFARSGQQEFFLVDRFRLGYPLGHLLGHVEVLITSLQWRLTDMLQPLMAIRNTDCIIELTAPNALAMTTDAYEGKAAPATSQELLNALALNLRRMKFKGFCIIVKYQGTIIFKANERKEGKNSKKLFPVGLLIDTVSIP